MRIYKFCMYEISHNSSQEQQIYQIAVKKFAFIQINNVNVISRIDSCFCRIGMN